MGPATARKRRRQVYLAGERSELVGWAPWSTAPAAVLAVSEAFCSAPFQRVRVSAKPSSANKAANAAVAIDRQSNAATPPNPSAVANTPPATAPMNPIANATIHELPRQGGNNRSTTASISPQATHATKPHQTATPGTVARTTLPPRA